MPNPPAPADLERLIADRGDRLMRAAIALTGSRQAGEDLLQAALERVLASQRNAVAVLARGSDPPEPPAGTEAYVRRTLYNLAADGWRRRGRWLQRAPLFRVQDQVVDDVAAVDIRDALARLLLQLPPRQRAVIVLRYWEQLTEAEIAELLGCSEGTVKSNASKGLRRLRELAADWDTEESQLAEERS